MKRLLVLLVVAGFLAGACAAGDDGTEDEGGATSGLAACDDAPPEEDVPGLPDAFPKPEGTIYTGGGEAGPSFIGEGYFDGSLPDAFTAYRAAFEDGGYDITKDEQEEHDAEVFFAGDDTTGQVNMFAECEGRTKLRITIRPE